MSAQDADTQPASTPLPASEAIPTTTGSGGDLYDAEYFWRDLQPWLKEQGYLLRPRYDPQWTPSWKKSKQRYTLCEDGQPIDVRVIVLNALWIWCSFIYNPQNANVLDATRLSDGSYVVLKVSQPSEADIGQYLSSSEMDSPNNHCVPILDVLPLPQMEGKVLIVMPMLRPFNDPKFETIGEAIDFFHQIFEVLSILFTYLTLGWLLFQGLAFMHKHNIAHRYVRGICVRRELTFVNSDCTANNVMMDPTGLYPESYHPIERHMTRAFDGVAPHITRSQMPPKYYLTDFGLSRRYSPEQRPPLEPIIRGGDKTVPEFAVGEPCDPFPIDVYYIGNLIRTSFTKVRYLYL
jgi:serine/threonine protein kinase